MQHPKYGVAGAPESSAFSLVYLYLLAGITLLVAVFLLV